MTIFVKSLIMLVMEEFMSMNTRHRFLHYSVRVIPVIMAAVCLLNTLLSYFYIDLPILSYIGGVSLFPLLFFYFASYALQFCSYHRLPLHYVTVNWALNIYDYYVGLPVSNKGLLMLVLIITCIFFFIGIYQHQKERRRRIGE